MAVARDATRVSATEPKEPQMHPNPGTLTAVADGALDPRGARPELPFLDRLIARLIARRAPR